MEGVGSIWNKNSWHWEEKNYTSKAKEYLKENLEAVEVVALTPRSSIIKITKVSEIKGSAVITIRKKKQMYIYEFEIEMEWTANEKEGEEEASGTVKIVDHHQDDDPEDINIEIKVTQQSDYADGVRSAINSNLKSAIIKVLMDYKELMKKIDADEKKVREDAEKRMKEEEEMKKAEEAKGTEKQKIFEEAKKKEAEMKMKEEAMKIVTKETDDKNKGTGSVWNPNSYFWEEKNLNKWSKEKIQELLGSFKHTVPNGALAVTEWEITGDSSISIRKGKKIVAFDFVIELKWKASLKEGDDESVITGIFKLPEVSSAVYNDGDQFDIIIEYKTGEENRSKLHDHLRGAVTDAIRKNLEKYATELNEKDS